MAREEGDVVVMVAKCASVGWGMLPGIEAMPCLQPKVHEEEENNRCACLEVVLEPPASAQWQPD